MSEWDGLEVAADALSRTPKRWSSSRFGPSDGEPREPPARTIEVGFGIVEEGLGALGPVARDEPTPTGFFDDALMDWLKFGERFPDRRDIDATSVRQYVEGLPGSPNYPEDRNRVTWPGMMRGWLRSQLGLLAQSIIMDVPPHYWPDPQGLREVSFRCLERVALLLPDIDQAGCLNLMAHREQQGVKELARRLYHHPEAGPHVKAMIDKMFVKRFAAKLKANPPESHDPIPWRT